LTAVHKRSLGAGFGDSAALFANVVNVVNVAINAGMTIVAVLLLDQVGRRRLLLTGTADTALGTPSVASAPSSRLPVRLHHAGGAGLLLAQGAETKGRSLEEIERDLSVERGEVESVPVRHRSVSLPRLCGRPAGALPGRLAERSRWPRADGGSC
jgi:Sugar (and other) transporter